MIERKLLVISKYVITSSKLSEKLDNTNFVILADLHNQSFGRNNKRLAKKIDKLAPDFILAAGDMINKTEPACPGNVFALLEELARKYKIYYAFGNHEQRVELYGELPREEIRSGENASDRLYGSEPSQEQKKLYQSWEEYRNRLTSLEVTFLNNESVVAAKNGARLRITGVSIGPEYFEWNKLTQLEEGYLTRIIGESSKEEYQILIAHNPAFFKDYAAWGANLTVSGHFHGGMVRIPGVGGLLSPQASFFPKYDSGRYTEDGQEMVVSRGLGSHSIMPRLFNIPEIVHINLKSR
jgi:predicted MPP superfamily phosphohydrolase